MRVEDKKYLEDLEDTELTIEDQFGDIAADVVSSEGSENFLKRLFALPVGHWAKACELSEGMSEIEDKLWPLEEEIRDDLWVMWLEYPNALEANGFCVILFFVGSLHWETTVLLNKQLFENEQLATSAVQQ